MFSLAQALPTWRKVETRDMQLAWTDAMVPAELYKGLEATWPAMPTPKVKARPGYIVRRDVTAADIAPVWTDLWGSLLGTDSLNALVDHWGLAAHSLPGFRALAERQRVFMSRVLAAQKTEISVLYSASFRWRAPSAHDPVISPHVDNPKSLCYLLWYFPVPGDKACGGDILFLKRKVQEPQSPADFKIVLRVPYAPNHAVLALNGPDVIHAVVPRVNADHPRRHVGLALDMPSPLFDVEDRHAMPCDLWTAPNVETLLAKKKKRQAARAGGPRK